MIIEEILKETRSNLNKINKTSGDFELSTNLKQFKGISLKGRKNIANRILFCNVVKCLIASFHSGKNLAFSFHTNGIDGLKNTKYINGLSDYSAQKAVNLFLKEGLIKNLGQTRKRTPNLFRPVFSLDDLSEETKIFKERTFIKRRLKNKNKNIKDKDLKINVTGYKRSLIKGMDDWKNIIENTPVTIPINSISKLTNSDKQNKSNYWLLLDALLVCDVKDDEVDIRYLFSAPQRIFTQRPHDKKTYNKGGRFYPEGTQIPKAVRNQIKIDGQKTIELDYSSLHPAMLASLSGETLPDDLYESIGKVLGKHRDEAKTAFNRAINDDIAHSSTKTAMELKAALEEIGCSWLNAHLYQDKGIQLQYLDSQIAQFVIQKLTNKGIAVLCIHDSFVIQQCHEELLREVMQTAWREIMQTERPITIKPFPYK